ncbi:Gfo/Idh/MocA family oxidoreductase [Roseiflexus castenholzii]|uniref:Gfo/Idh/MocA family protein n=1 Tax=Roseiflexus castenholzii TaxID=120962 RepID=UPI002352474B
MTSPWRVGIVGLHRGQGLVSTLAAHPRVQIAALCDLDSGVLAEMGARFNLHDQALFNDFYTFVEADIDIVVIATPIEFHADQSITALEHGKHVLSEQTAAYTLNDCDRLVQTVRRTGRSYMMAENYCYFHYIRSWREIIKSGKLGRIVYAEAAYLHEITDLLIDPHTGQRYWRYTRPPILYCAHCLGPLLSLMDDRIVRATGLHSGQSLHPDKGIGFLDMEVGLFQTHNGAIIKILRSQVAPRHPELISYSLQGTHGFIENGRSGGWGASEGLLYIEGEMPKHPGAQPLICDPVDAALPPEARAGGHGTSEYFMVNDFIESLDRGISPPIDVIRAVEFTVPGICAHESAMQGGVWIDVPQYR